MPKFNLRRAEITQDGELVRVLFVAGLAAGDQPCDRLADLGFVDYLPQANAGLKATLDGQPLRVVGVQCEDWTEPLPWIDPPTTGGSIPAGSYFFLIAFVDAAGNEIGVCPPIYGNSNETGELGVDIPANGAIKFFWRTSPAGTVKVRLYAGTQKTTLGNLRQIAEWTEIGLPYLLKSYTPDDSKPFKRQSVGLWVTLKRTTNSVTLGELPRLVMPAGLVQDEHGNGTPPVITYPTNYSLVNVSRTIDGDAWQYAATYCLSSSHGDDANDGSQGKPWKTLSKLFRTVPTQANIRVRFLRGDVFPFESWTTAYYGSLGKPTVYDSYWNADYGVDPKSQPVLMGDTSNDPDPNGLRNWFRQGDSRTGRLADAPFQYFLDLTFQGPIGDSCKGPVWPAGGPQDHVVLANCLFDNVQLIGSYGSAQKLAPIKNALYQVTVQNVHTSPSNPAHVQGLFIAHCGDFLISHCVFDQCGWRYDGTEPTPKDNDVFCHGVYLAQMTRQTLINEGRFRNNGLSGVQQRGGGVCVDAVFDGNVSGYSAHDTHMLCGAIFQGQGTYNHIVSPAPSWGPVTIHDFNHTGTIGGFNEKRQVCVNYDGLHSFHHNSEGAYVPDAIAVRKERSDNGGDLSIGNQLPVRYLAVTDNRVNNQAKDYRGNPLRNVSLKPVSVGHATKITWDRNIYTATVAKDAYVWCALTTGSFATWQAYAGLDAHSVELAPGQPDPTPAPIPTPVPPTPEPLPPTPQPLPPIAFEPLIAYLRSTIKAAQTLLTALGAK
jgi:hypothetical protein